VEKTVIALLYKKAGSPLSDTPLLVLKQPVLHSDASSIPRRRKLLPTKTEMDRGACWLLNPQPQVFGDCHPFT
jgi:hypothetical protein